MGGGLKEYGSDRLWMCRSGHFTPGKPRRASATFMEQHKMRPSHVIGPLGEPLTLEALPSPATKRWIPRRKAEVVAAVDGGLLTLSEACDRYALSIEEFAAWQRGVDRAGLAGLRATKIQFYREKWERHGI